MSRPTGSTPRFATDDTYSTAPYSGEDTKVEPSAGIKARGLKPEKRVPAQWLNWLLGQGGEYLDWLVNVQPQNWDDPIDTDIADVGITSGGKDIKWCEFLTSWFLCDGDVYRSEDGRQWVQEDTAIASNGGAPFSGGSGGFIHGGTGANARVSNDGLSWANESVPGTVPVLRDWVHDNGADSATGDAIAIGDDSATGSAWYYNGTSLTKVTITGWTGSPPDLVVAGAVGGTSGTPLLICFLRNVGGSIKMGYSDDGARTWTVITPSITKVSDVAYSPEEDLWLLTNDDQEVWTTSDPRTGTWAKKCDVPFTIERVAVNGGLWVGYMKTGVRALAVYSSDQGATWRATPIAMGGAEPEDIEFGDGRFVISITTGGSVRGLKLWRSDPEVSS